MAARRSYDTTEVPVSKSQDEIRGLLRKFGADQFSFGEGTDWAGIEFVHGGQLVRLRCPLRLPTADAITKHRRASHKSLDDSERALLEQDSMRVWRVLVWSVKARLVAVDEGLETFEQAFLSHLVDPSTNATLWQAVREAVEGGMFQIGGPGLKALGMGS